MDNRSNNINKNNKKNTMNVLSKEQKALTSIQLKATEGDCNTFKHRSM